MKKLFVAGLLGVFAMGMFSCGHGTCDAYREADYSKYKKEQKQKIEIVSELSEKK